MPVAQHDKRLRYGIDDRCVNFCASTILSKSIIAESGSDPGRGSLQHTCWVDAEHILIKDESQELAYDEAL